MKEEPAKCQGWCEVGACGWKSGMQVGDELGFKTLSDPLQHQVGVVILHLCSG